MYRKTQKYYRTVYYNVCQQTKILKIGNNAQEEHLKLCINEGKLYTDYGEKNRFLSILSIFYIKETFVNNFYFKHFFNIMGIFRSVEP